MESAEEEREEMNKIIKRLNKFAQCAKSHGVDATWCRTKSSHYSLRLSKGDKKAKPLIFASSSSDRRAAQQQRQRFRRAMRTFDIDIANTGLSLSFHTSVPSRAL